MRRNTFIPILFALISLVLLSNHALTSPAQSLSSTPGGTHVTVIVEPKATMMPLYTAIQNASSSIDVVMYQFEDPKLAQALAQSADRGVSVRVLLNGGYYGKKENTDNDSAYQYLMGHHVIVHWTPAYFALTHQKTLIVDKVHAFIMTGNFTPQYYASSRDFMVDDANIDDVIDAEETFDADWNGTSHTTHPDDALVWSPGSEQLLLDMITGATKTLDIYNQEMADKKIIQALQDTASHGIQIRIVMTDNTRWHKTWHDLQKEGVQVHIYDTNAPTYIHAKMILADNTHMFIGSENFSKNSLEKNRELGIITSDLSAIRTIKAVFESDWSATTELEH